MRTRGDPTRAHRRAIQWTLGVVWLLLVPSAAHAAFWAVEVGYGEVAPVFSEHDQIRDPPNRTLFDNAGMPYAENSGAMQFHTINDHLFLELSLSPHWAFGWHVYRFEGFRETDTPPGDPVTLFGAPFTDVTFRERVDIESNFLTASYLPVNERLWRWGLMGGVGQTQYKYRQQVFKHDPCIIDAPDLGAVLSLATFGLFSGCSNEDDFYTETSGSTGAVALAGAFIEYGRGVGVRASLNYIATGLPRMSVRRPDNTQTSLAVSSSGWMLSLEVFLASRPDSSEGSPGKAPDGEKPQ